MTTGATPAGESPDWQVLWREQVDERQRFVCVQQKDWKVLYLFFKHPRFKGGQERYLRQMIHPLEEKNGAIDVIDFLKREMLHRMHEEMRELDAPDYLATFKRIADVVASRAYPPGATRQNWPDYADLEYQLYEDMRWEEPFAPPVVYHRFALTPGEKADLRQLSEEMRAWCVWSETAQHWEFLHWRAWMKLYYAWEDKQRRERDRLMGW